MSRRGSMKKYVSIVILAAILVLFVAIPVFATLLKVRPELFNGSSWKIRPIGRLAFQIPRRE